MSGTFYTHRRTISYEKDKDVDPLLLYESQFWLSETTEVYNRQIYGWFDLLGDMGGVTDAMVLLFSFIFCPISHHLFVIKAIQKLFYAKTKDNDLFRDDKKHEHEPHFYHDK